MSNEEKDWGAEKIAILTQIDAETHKDERLKYCSLIDTTYQKIITELAPYEKELSQNKSVKYILVHLLTIFGYAKDVSILQQMGWNNSITNITRDLLECYAYAKKLIGLYGSSAYEDYVRNLVVNDMDQDKRIYLSLYSDSTIVDISKRDSEAKTYIQRFENLITEYFPQKLAEISIPNKENDILKVIKDLKREYNQKYPDNGDKSALISEAIQNNKLLQDYDGSKVLYKALCHSTHNTLSSLEERTLRNGFFMMNNCTYNIFACVQLLYYCMEDCFQEFTRIIQSTL